MRVGASGLGSILSALLLLVGCTGFDPTSPGAEPGAQTEAGGGYHLAFTTRPHDTAIGTRFRPAVRVAVLDAHNRPVEGLQVPITLRLAEGGALSGRTLVPSRHGVARFDELVPEENGKGLALVASAPGLPSVRSQTFQAYPRTGSFVELSVTAPSARLAAGHAQALTAVGRSAAGERRDVTSWVAWSSSNPRVAEVTAAGLVSIRQPGVATITAEVDGVSSSLGLTGTDATLVSITLDPPAATAPSHTETSFSAVGTFSDGSTLDLTEELAWSTSSSELTSILEPGVVEAVAPGSTSITASDPGGLAGAAPLTVNPCGSQVPVFSTYLGGKTAFNSDSALTFAQNAAVDTDGCTYVTGATSTSDLPLVEAAQTAPYPGSTWTGFVAKYGVDGNLLWCTYLGGDGQTMGTGLAVLPGGQVAVTGWTSSSQGFPLVNAFQSQYGGKNDAFLTVYGPQGEIQTSTYLGGSGVEGPGPFTDDSANGINIAVDGQGLLYLVGETSSNDFPLTPDALQKTLNLGPRPPPTPTDAYLCIVDPTASGASFLVYSSLLGGEKNEKGHAVAVDPGASAINVVGYTDSREFPTTPNAYRSTAPAGHFTSNGFVTRFLRGPTMAMGYSTYLGASRDDAYAVTLAPGGQIAVTGRTQSPDFPVTPSLAIYKSAPYLVPGRGDQPYLVRIDPSRSGDESLAYGSYLGGGSAQAGGSFATGIALDPSGAIYVGGETLIGGTPYLHTPPPLMAPESLPFTPDALFTSTQGSTDCMLMRISPGGATLDYSTFFGGAKSDRTYGLATDPSGGVRWAGLTFSRNFPLQRPAQRWPGNTGSQNAFVTRLASSGPALNRSR